MAATPTQALTSTVSTSPRPIAPIRTGSVAGCRARAGAGFAAAGLIGRAGDSRARGSSAGNYPPPPDARKPPWFRAARPSACAPRTPAGRARALRRAERAD